MEGQWFTDANGSLVHPDDIGDFVGETKIGSNPRITGTRAPITRRSSSLRPIAGGSPGFWNDLRVWWNKLPSWQKGAVIGVPVVAGIAIAASQKDKGSSLEKV